MRHLVLLLGFVFVLGASLAWAPAPTQTDNDAHEVKRAKRVKTAIAWNVQPKEVLIYLDGKKLGAAGDVTQTRTKPGMHTVRLVKGGDETEMDVKVNKGHVLTFTFEFTE